MTLATRDSGTLAYLDDPTGGRLIAWAAAASAANQLAKSLVKTQFVPKHYQGKEYDATAAILMGDELGLKPLAALRSIFVVHGTPSMYARTMVALAQSQGHEIWTETDTPEKVVVCGHRRNSDKIERSEWTIARARKAGYTSNPKYESNAQEMLYAKAATTVARKVAADVLAGVPFSVEELELEEPIPTTTVKRAGETTKARRAAASSTPEPPLAEPGLEFSDGEEVLYQSSTPAVAEPTGDPITDAQMKKLQAHYKDTDRAERLAEAGSVLGVDVASFSELSKVDASRLIEWINGPDSDQIAGD